MNALLNSPYYRYLLERARRLEARARPVFAGQAEHAAWRDDVVARLRAAVRWEAYQRDWPLRAACVGSTERAGYVIERVRFESAPGFVVPALVYRPMDVASGRRLPAIVNPVGHWPHGKVQPVVQARCIAAAKLGYLALTFDNPCWGERRWQGRDHEAVRPSCLLVGHTLLGLLFWETSRALDYLVSRSDVDPARLACTGASGGGLNTLFTGLLDERIGVLAPCVYAMTLGALVERRHAGCCAYLPGHAQVGDVDELHAALAPRPLLILGAEQDQALCRSFARMVETARSAYRLYDADRLAWFCDPDSGHDYSRAMRERWYGWLARWLDGRATTFAPVPEPDDVASELLPPDDPALTVLTDDGDRGSSIHALNRIVADAYRARRPAAQLQLPDPVSGWTSDAYGIARPIETSLCGKPGFHQFETAPGLTVTALFAPGRRADLPPVVLLSEDDTGGDRKPLRNTWRFWPRGMSPQGSREGREDEDLYAMALGEPTMAGQVADVRALVRWVGEQTKAPPLLAAVGAKACAAAVLAARGLVLEGLVLQAPLTSWRGFLERELRPDYSVALPFQLTVGDMDALLAALAPLPLTIGDARDAAGTPASASEIDALLAPVREAYAWHGCLCALVYTTTPVDFACL